MSIRDVVALGCRCFLASLLPVRSKMNSQRLVFSMAVIGGLAVFGLMGGDLFLAHPVQADEENVVTVVSGTDAADTMTLTDPIDAQAGLLTDQSEKIEASATALDALAGSDVILSGADVAASADATALLWQILDAKTQALAKAMGLVAGDDNDTLTSSGALAVTSLASGAYGGGLFFDTGDRDGDDRKIDLSLSTEAGSTAIDGGDGDDTILGGAEAAEKIKAAAEVADFNARLVADGVPYLLLGPGRWGSSDRWLGIPVRWDQIAGARVIVETDLPDFKVTPSEGTHFFQNLTSFQVGYFTVNHGRDHHACRWELLDELPAVSEGTYLRHVRLAEPIDVRIDGTTRRGLVALP